MSRFFLTLGAVALVAVPANGQKPPKPLPPTQLVVETSLGPDATFTTVLEVLADQAPAGFTGRITQANRAGGS